MTQTEACPALFKTIGFVLVLEPPELMNVARGVLVPAWNEHKKAPARGVPEELKKVNCGMEAGTDAVCPKDMPTVRAKHARSLMNCLPPLVASPNRMLP